MSDFLIKIAKRDAKYAKIEMIDEHIKLFYEEIKFRNGVIDNLKEQSKMLMAEAEELQIEISQIETEPYIKEENSK